MEQSHQGRERRQKRRHTVRHLEGSLLFSYRCRVIDLSEEGVALRTTTPLAPGRSYSIKLEHGGKQVRLAGTVAWCRLAGTERSGEDEVVPVYRAGIELPDGFPEEGGSLAALLEERAVIRLERRLDGRITPENSPDVAEAPAFVVRRLSRTGMVLETSFHPTVGERLRLEVRVEDEILSLSVEVEEVRSLAEPSPGPGAGEPREPLLEIAVAFRALDEIQQRLLDDLIREELGRV